MAARMEKSRRPRGTGSLATHRDKAGRETWYGRFYVDGRLVKRRIGPKRAAGTRDGLTRSHAEKALRRLMEEGGPFVPAEQRVDLQEAAERYLQHLEGKGRKASTLKDYRSFLRVHLVALQWRTPLPTVASGASAHRRPRRRRPDRSWAGGWRPRAPIARPFALPRPSARRSGPLVPRQCLPRP
jgi:hypothetical protein